MSEGATVATGGKTWGSKGFYVEPTILTDCTPTMKCVVEEIFGPVLVVSRFWSYAVEAVTQEERVIRFPNSHRRRRFSSLPTTQRMDSVRQSSRAMPSKRCGFRRSCPPDRSGSTSTESFVRVDQSFKGNFHQADSFHLQQTRVFVSHLPLLFRRHDRSRTFICCSFRRL